MDGAKKTRTSQKRTVYEKNARTEKQHGSLSYGGKLKNETSADRSYGKKFRTGKKDNHMPPQDIETLQKKKYRGKEKLYKEIAAEAAVRRYVITNEDENSGTDGVNAGIDMVESGAGRVRAHGQSHKYTGKIHERVQNRNSGFRVDPGNGNAELMTLPEKAARKKQMQRKFADAGMKKQMNPIGDISKRVRVKTEGMVELFAERGKNVLVDHAMGLITGMLILLAVLSVSGALSSCSVLSGGINGATVVTSFTAENEDILQVEADYVELESELQKQINHVETDHPGYDEYNYSLAEISHNPFELAALLTVLYEDYTPEEVRPMLQNIFDHQYTLAMTETVIEGDEDEDDYYILNVSLRNNGLSAAINAANLNQEQMERYTVLMETKGNKPDIFEDNVYANPGVSDEYERYAVPGEYLTNQQFANMLQEAKKYLGYPYVWGGASPSTSFDCSGFVSYVINHCGNGWNYGRLTANGWKNATARVVVSDVRAGDLVFFQGTYNTSGASHVGIVVDPVNKVMIHCGNPIQYASYDTPFWRAHAYCYGRIQ